MFLFRYGLLLFCKKGGSNSDDDYIYGGKRLYFPRCDNSNNALTPRIKKYIYFGSADKVDCWKWASHATSQGKICVKLK